MIYGFTFMDQRPEDINPMLLVESRDIGFPSKTKITSTVPFSNIEYDFSEIYGAQVYSSRKVKYVINVLNIDELSPDTMHHLKTSLVNWLETSHGRQKLVDDVLSDYHFMGEIRDAVSLADNVETGELTVTFDCYPFMIGNRAEGDDIWDDFSFEDGIAQEVQFDVTDQAEVLLINPSATDVAPTVTVTGAAMKATIGSVTYDLPVGASTGLSLPPGDVTIQLSGTGTVAFDWHREVI